MQWEYKTLQGNMHHTERRFLEGQLAELGKEGWEAVGIAQTPPRDCISPVTVLLKRPLKKSVSQASSSKHQPAKKARAKKTARRTTRK